MIQIARMFASVRFIARRRTSIDVKRFIHFYKQFICIYANAKHQADNGNDAVAHTFEKCMRRFMFGSVVVVVVDETIFQTNKLSRRNRALRQPTTARRTVRLSLI